MAVRRGILAVALGTTPLLRRFLSAPQQTTILLLLRVMVTWPVWLPVWLLLAAPAALLLIRGVLSLVVTMTGVAAPTTNLRSKPVSAFRIVIYQSILRLSAGLPTLREHHDG